MKFVILLWGKKSSLATDIIGGMPIFSFNEIIELGRESRRALRDSHDASKSIWLNIHKIRYLALMQYFLL